MKYNQPYGVSDPNAAYINGNPSTGTMGSIPPAEAIETPQREIVNFITSSGLSPTAADLFQLAKSVQNGVVNFAADAGTPNQIAVTLAPALTAYNVGLRLIIKVAYANTTQVVINANAIGAVPLVHADLTQLAGGELKAGQMIECVYDGTHFQMLSGGSGGGYILLTAPRSVYVNPTTGSDTAYDGSQAAVVGTHGPFLTITRALQEMTKYNLGGWSFSIYLADGTYNITATIAMPAPNGSGTVLLIGNHGNPRNCLVYNTATGSCFFFATGGNWQVDGISFRTTATAPGDAANCIWLAAAAYVTIAAVAFGPCAGSHIGTQNATLALVTGPVEIWGGASQSHYYATANSAIGNYQTPAPSPLNITAAVSFANFVVAAAGAYVQPIWGTITGYGNVSGTKYAAAANGIIDVGGRGASYLPGTVAGSLATGGQIV
jgi:hypothetical protein